MKIVSEPKVAHYLRADPSRAFWSNPFTQCASSFFSLSALFPAPAFPQQFPVPALSSDLNRCQPNVTSLPVRETKENDLLPLPGCPADSSAQCRSCFLLQTLTWCCSHQYYQKTRVCMKTAAQPLQSHGDTGLFFYGNYFGGWNKCRNSHRADQTVSSSGFGSKPLWFLLACSWLGEGGGAPSSADPLWVYPQHRFCPL